jgi:phosphotransferase system  glucose/maltose/N-acetylglucosamine-specific IIC component
MLIFVSALATRQSPIFASENKVSAFIGAAVTWAAIAPTVSLIVNTTPIFFSVGELLLGRDYASRYALGGIIGGTVATYVAAKVYRVLAKNKW